MTTNYVSIARQRRLIALATLPPIGNNIISLERRRATLRPAPLAMTFASARSEMALAA